MKIEVEFGRMSDGLEVDGYIFTLSDIPQQIGGFSYSDRNKARDSLAYFIERLQGQLGLAKLELLAMSFPKDEVPDEG